MGPRTLPFGVAAIMRTLLHDVERDEVVDDLAAEYALRAARDGRGRARAWAWRQVRSSVPGLLSRGWFRGTTGFESEANRMRGGGMTLESWINDIRFALRSMRARKQYTVLSVLTLALGIGGTTAVFAIARTLLLSPLPYAANDELVMFWNQQDWSEAEMVYLGDEWQGFRGVAAYRSEDVFMRIEGSPARLIPGIASDAKLFDVLGARPMLGGGFARGADAVGAEPTAVLSYGLWQELGANRDIIGTVLQLDGEPRRIVGVMPQGFWFPDPSVRVWLSTPMRPDNGSGNYTLVGRLDANRPLTAMSDPLRVITERLSGQFTYTPQWDKTKNAELTPLRTFLLGPVRPALLATLAGMAVILLMACANVATLMLAQLNGRTTELAVRVALGAGRRRITQQLLVEALALGLLAGAFGALAAATGFKLLVAALPLGELSAAVSADWTLFATALLISLTAAILIALAPVFSLWRGDLRDALSRGRTAGIGPRGGRLEDMLVIGEVALALVLAASAAVLIRSVGNLRGLDPGVDTRGIAVVDITSSGDVAQELRRQHIGELVTAIGALPGVTAAGAVQRLPLRDRGDHWGISIQSKPELAPTTTAWRLVTHDYFDVMGIELKSGRLFEETDRLGTELVVVIDETLAQKYFPAEDPLNQMIASGLGQGWMRIIGVVSDVSHGGLTSEPLPGRYMLYDQLNYTPESTAIVMKVSSGRDPAAVLQQAISTIQQTTSTVAVREATTMEQVFAIAMGPTRRIMQLMTLLGVLALTLGAVGVYGVVSHFVSRRRRDWVIRMALGMRPVAALQEVVTRGVMLVGFGCVLGLLATTAMTRVLTSLLYEVDAADPLALVAASATLIAAGCIAALVPGLRASRANPAQVLRDSV